MEQRSNDNGNALKPLKTIPAGDKIRAVKDFAECYSGGGELTEERRAEYLRYIKSQRRRLLPHALKHIPLLSVMLAEKMIKIDEIDELIESAAEIKNAEISVMLLNYKNSAFTAEEKACLEQRRITAMLTGAMPLSELKKNWLYEKAPDGGVRILGYKGREKRVLVPEMIGGSPVTEITGQAFSPKAKFMSLKKRYARCLIEAVYIPAGVRHIEMSTFDRCYALQEIVIAPDNPVYSAVDSIVITKSENTCVFCPQGKIGSATIPNGVVKIGNRAFHGCRGLTSVTIPESVTEIGEHAFSDCTDLRDIAIPESVTKIKRHAFSGCESLTGVTLPRGVTRIGEYTFCGCTSLTGIGIHDGVSVIGNSAFSMCTGLCGITVPGCVTEIGWLAFDHCNRLGELRLPRRIKEKYKSEEALRGILGIMDEVVIR